MAEIHINAGIVALARGFITLEEFARGMNHLATGHALSIRDLWVGPGRLDEGQLAMVLDAIGPATGRDTMIYNVQPKQPMSSGDDTQLGKAGPVKLLQVPVGTATAPTAPSLVPPIPQPVPPQHLVAVSDPSVHSGAARGAPPPVELVGARYKRLFLLGAGGLGEVTACEDMVLGRTVAVKAGHMKGDVDSYSS